MKGAAICMMMLHHCFSGADRYSGYDVDFLLLGEYLTVLLSQFCKICVAILFSFSATLSISHRYNFDFCVIHKKHRHPLGDTS